MCNQNRAPYTKNILPSIESRYTFIYFLVDALAFFPGASFLALVAAAFFPLGADFFFGAVFLVTVVVFFVTVVVFLVTVFFLGAYKGQT